MLALLLAVAPASNTLVELMRQRGRVRNAAHRHPAGGDTNDDCAINIQDLAFMGYRFNACEGDPLYDGRGDINADGCINILDLAMAGGSFDQACPVPW